MASLRPAEASSWKNCRWGGQVAAETGELRIHPGYCCWTIRRGEWGTSLFIGCTGHRQSRCCWSCNRPTRPYQVRGQYRLTGVGARDAGVTLQKNRFLFFPVPQFKPIGVYYKLWTYFSWVINELTNKFQHKIRNFAIQLAHWKWYLIYSINKA